ncbi:MAG: STAS domain-containing protein [Pseudomonadota bacterium]
MATIELPERLRIDTAGAVWADLRAALDLGDSLELHAGAVAEVDAAGIQLLAMAWQTARTRDQALTLVAMTPELEQGLHALGLSAVSAGEGATDNELGEMHG